MSCWWGGELHPRWERSLNGNLPLYPWPAAAPSYALLQTESLPYISTAKALQHLISRAQHFRGKHRVIGLPVLLPFTPQSPDF